MIPFKQHDLKPVTQEEMAQIFEKIKTPYKYGAVMKLPNDWTDCPSVFFYDGRWYMYFISISKDVSVSGYETHMAVSDDLLHWEKISTIFPRDDQNRWDSKQRSGYVAFMDIRWDGTNAPQAVNGKYYMSYMAGNSDGYEPDPLRMGLASGKTPIDAFTRFPDPILAPDDADARQDETKTLYRSFLFKDEARITGFPYVNVYNAKSQAGRERIFAAVSSDGETWERYGDAPIIDEIKLYPTQYISGDPQIVKMDDIYVMFYFRYIGGKAFDTFACSRDFVHWTRWEGEPLVESSEECDITLAHKPWVINHEGVVYHYYCAVNDDKKERCIALATSKKIEE